MSDNDNLIIEFLKENNKNLDNRFTDLKESMQDIRTKMESIDSKITNFESSMEKKIDEKINEHKTQCVLIQSSAAEFSYKKIAAITAVISGFGMGVLEIVKSILN